MLTTNEIIGQNILRILQEKNISQAELANELGWSRQKMNKILHGRRNITASDLIIIADALGVSIEGLVTEDVELENTEPITVFLGQVETAEAKAGLRHAQKIMDMIVFHQEVQENKDKLTEEWDV